MNLNFNLNLTMEVGRTFEWEKIDQEFWSVWFNHKRNLSFLIVGIYVGFIQLGLKWMKSQQPLRLRSILVIWNLTLFTISLLAFVRSLPTFLVLLMSPHGLHKSVCGGRDQGSLTTFWIFVGIWSKVLELGDTAFIILRKQPLIFLHWYHHSTVLLYLWNCGYSDDSSNLWFWVMNSGIHSLMYGYYALRAIGKKLPKKMSVGITTLQIVQMVVGMTINIYSLYAKVFTECGRPNENILYSFVLYLSYCVLFARYFKSAYFSTPKPKLN